MSPFLNQRLKKMDVDGVILSLNNGGLKLMKMNGKIKAHIFWGKKNQACCFLDYSFVFSILETRYFRPNVLHKIGLNRVAHVFFCQISASYFCT
jgi:hypothetical protein